MLQSVGPMSSSPRKPAIDEPRTPTVARGEHGATDKIMAAVSRRYVACNQG